MPKGCYLFNEDHTPAKAAFPVVDAHNHAWGKWDVAEVVKVMDEVGVASYCDLTANRLLTWADGGYEAARGSLQEFLNQCVAKYPGRFYGFTMAGFVRPHTEPLFDDAEKFAAECVEILREDVALGARGLKILKELGLHHRDAAGELVRIDDERLAPIWDAAGQLGVPALIHQSDPYGFFQPPTEENEHYETLKKYPSWGFSDPRFPRKDQLLDRRDKLVRRHPNTTFILAHVANFAENLAYVSSLLDENPNVYIDFSARIDELGRQPYTARDFLIRYQDRIVFGADMPASVEMYRCYFRFLETYDEYFFPPDYDGTFDRHRWAICGVGLPKEVLAKIYYANALKIIPGLDEDLKGRIPAD